MRPTFSDLTSFFGRKMVEMSFASGELNSTNENVEIELSMAEDGQESIEMENFGYVTGREIPNTSPEYLWSFFATPFELTKLRK